MTDDEAVTVIQTIADTVSFDEVIEVLLTVNKLGAKMVGLSAAMIDEMTDSTAERH
jgi:hypothetical protein